MTSQYGEGDQRVSTDCSGSDDHVHVPCPCMNLQIHTVNYANVKDEKLFLIKIIACERTRVTALGS